MCVSKTLQSSSCRHMIQCLRTDYRRVIRPHTSNREIRHLIRNWYHHQLNKREKRLVFESRNQTQTKIKQKLTLVNTVLTFAQGTNVCIRQFTSPRISNYTILQDVQLNNHGRKTTTTTTKRDQTKKNVPSINMSKKPWQTATQK